MRSVLASMLTTAAALLLLLSVACGDDDDSDDSQEQNDVTSDICVEGAADCDDTVEDDDSNQGTPAPSAEPCTDAATCQEQSTNIALQDLAAELAADSGSITVVSAQAVEWPDSCLGITREGVVCAQVITPGFRIILASGGNQYEYHTDNGTRAVLVEQPTPTH
jgi:hypothetical protein